MKKLILQTSTTFSLFALAATASAGTFLTATIDGAFSEWASVPVLDSDPVDNPGSVDIATIKIANDDDYLYVYYTHHTATSLSTFLAIDSDSDKGTGYDIFGLGLIGADAQWQNDFPFTSDVGVFNNGEGMSGEFFGSGAALLAPFGDAMEHELAISLDVVYNEFGKGALFDDSDFSLLLWTDAGLGDASSAIDYTLAVPEPTTSLLIAVFGLVTLRRRR